MMNSTIVRSISIYPVSKDGKTPAIHGSSHHDLPPSRHLHRHPTRRLPPYIHDLLPHVGTWEFGYNFMIALYP